MPGLPLSVNWANDRAFRGRYTTTAPQSAQGNILSVH
jgi:hypothetical protein